MSLLITRSDFDRKYLHSTEGTEFNPRTATFQDFDLRHVEEKLLEWKQQKKKVGDQEPVATSEIIAGRFPESKTLIRRLATANTRRREQLIYWSKHPDKLATEVDLIDPMVNEQKVLAIEHTEDAKPALRSEAQHKETESQQPKFILTRETFSNAPASDISGTQTVVRPARTIYAESTVGNKSLNRVPQVPITSRSMPTFECPYCHITLDSQLMKNRQEWK